MVVDGKRAARQRGCKYTEISATLGHNVDQLLVGVLQQIRLSRRHAALRQSWSLSSPLTTAHRSRAGSVAGGGGGGPGQLVDCRRPGVSVDAGRVLVQTRHRILAKIMSSLSLSSSWATSSVCDNLYVL